MKLKTVKQKQKRNSKPHGKVIKSLVPVGVVVVCIALILCIVLPRLPQKPQSDSGKHYRGVVELWNVESFEGGSGSRSAWLTSLAAKFEKSHEGLFVHVTNLTEQQLQDKLENGETFDIICFSRGVGAMVQPLLSAYSGSVQNVKDNFLVSGEVDNTQYALPLYTGAYCLFARTSQLANDSDLLETCLTNTYVRKVGKQTYNLQPLVCGFTAHNSPLSALALAGARGKISPDENITQYAAYESFVGNKTAVALLGTQRDMFRLGKKLQDGKIEPLSFAPLAEYTDLVQYLAISSTCGDKASCCTEFLQYTISPEAQQSLVNVDMFSVLQQTFYTTDWYAQCEQGLAHAYVPNVFGDEQSLKTQRQTAISTLGM